MPFVSVNMAVPLKDNNNRESQIYFLASAENVSQEDSIGNKKYAIIKILQMIFVMSALAVFAYGVRNDKIAIQDMLICVAYGGLICYCLMFALFSLQIKERPILLVSLNIMTVIILFSIGGGTISSWWNIDNLIHDMQMEHPQNKIVLDETSATVRLTSSLISIFNGIFFMSETLIMVLEVRELI